MNEFIIFEIIGVYSMNPIGIQLKNTLNVLKEFLINELLNPAGLFTKLSNTKVQS